jgi:predicted alpha/beta superfamily hydrolase
MVLLKYLNWHPMMKKILIFGLLFFQVFQISAQNLHKVTFNFKVPNNLNASDSLYYIAGDFNNWNPHDSRFKFNYQKDNLWNLEIAIPAGPHEFKLTKGDWNSVECAEDGKGIANRVINLSSDTTIHLLVVNFQDAFIKNPPKSTASVNVSRITSMVHMPYLSLDRNVWIYLPPSYQKSNKRYPVIYMQDGQNLFDTKTSGYGEWGVDELLDSFAKFNKGDYIVVGIDHSGVSRLTEYNPYDSKFGKGTGDLYVDFLVHNLKPFIDSKYRTSAKAKYTTIAGSSMGGLISMYAIAKYPKIFGNAGVFSPSFWIAPKMYDFVDHQKLKKSRIYFVAGAHESEEMANDMERMSKLLLENGVPQENIKSVIKKDGKHSEWFWHQEFAPFIDWLGTD